MSDDIARTVEAHVRSTFAAPGERASVTFLGLEPIDILRFTTDSEVVFVTVGCARHPMADPSDVVADPVRGPRAEVVLRLHRGHSLPGAHHAAAVLAAAPAVEGAVLAPDLLVDLSAPMWTGSSCTAVVLEPDVMEECTLTAPMSPVTFLRAVPITANEAAWVRLRGVDELRRAWREADVDVTDPERVAVDPGR